MMIDFRTRRGPRAAPLVLGLCLGVACGAEDDPPPPASADTEDTGDTDPTTGTPPPPEGTTTSGAAGSTGEDLDTSADGESSTGEGIEDPIDPNLDRSEPNILEELCGYPGPGPGGYGGTAGTSRFPNFVLEDCGGNQREFAEFFCRREDEYEDFNHAFIVVFEAMW